MFPKPVHKPKKRRVRLRPKGTVCLINSPGCGGQIDWCHIRSKGAGGPDEDWNLFQACRFHHRMQHAYAFDWMFRAFPHFWEHIKSMGWEWDQKTGKLWHPYLAVDRV